MVKTLSWTPKSFLNYAFTGEVLKTTVLSEKKQQHKKPGVEEHHYVGTCSIYGDLPHRDIIRTDIYIGESLLTLLFTFFLINIRLCVQKASRKTRIDYEHLKNL